VIAFFEEGLGLKRHASAALLGFITLLGSCFVVYFSKNMEALDTMDFWVGTFLIVCLTFFQSILYGWIFGIERGAQEAHRGAQMRIPTFVQYVLKYVAPVYLAVMLAFFVVGDIFGLRLESWRFVKYKSGYAAKILENPVVLSTLLLIGVIGAFLLLLIHIAGKRWQADGRLSRPTDERSSR
jgi:hypothetical protein